MQYQECTACFAIKNKTPAQVRVGCTPPVFVSSTFAAVDRVWLNVSPKHLFCAQEYLESKFGPAAAEASGEEKRLSSEELWGAPIWNHDDPSGGLGNSTAG